MIERVRPRLGDDDGMTTPLEYAMLRRPVTANSRPMITATIQAGAASI